MKNQIQIVNNWVFQMHNYKVNLKHSIKNINKFKLMTKMKKIIKNIVKYYKVVRLN